MRSKTQIAIISAIIAIITILLLQSMWIRRSHDAQMRYVEKQNSELLERAVRKYLNIQDIRYQDLHISDTIQWRWGTKVNDDSLSIEIIDYGTRDIIIKRTYDSREKYMSYRVAAYTQNIYHIVETDMPLLDSIYNGLLSEVGMSLKYILEIIDTQRDSVLHTTATGNDARFDLATQPQPLGLDEKDVVIARFEGSMQGVWVQSRNLVIASILIVVILTVIILWLANFVASQYRSERTREEFVEAVLHETKNPLLYISQLIRSAQSEDKTKVLDQIEGKVGKLMNTTHKLLISNASNKKIHLTTEEFNLRQMLENIIGQHSDISLDYQREDEMIRADRTHYQNAISNLVENAVQYSPQCARIEIRCYENAGRIYIAVKDNGIGVSQGEQEKIFQKFYRAHNARSISPYSFGLGLYYVKTVAHSHGGDVSLSSRQGEGSEFIFYVTKL